MRGLRAVVVSMVTLLSLIACEPNDGSGTDVMPTNTYTINGAEHHFGSVVATMIGDNIAFLASPTEGLRSVEAILASREYLYGAISPTLNNREFDLKSEKQIFTFISTLMGAELHSVAPELTDEIVEGRARILLADEVLTAEGHMQLANGNTLTFKVEAPAAGLAANENSLSRGDEVKPVRAAFYRVDNDVTTLYLTPGGISYFEELSEVSWYIYLSLRNEDMTGAAVNIATLSDFVFGLEDNVYTNKSFCISSADLDGASGLVAVAKLGDGRYSVELSLSVNGVAYSASFNGECISCDLEPERKSNYLIYNGAECALTSAAMTLVQGVWNIALQAADASVATVTIPQSFLDGNAKGFSQSADLTVTYDGRTYSKANGDSGTVTASLNEADSTLSLHFTNYTSLELDYSGPVTIR